MRDRFPTVCATLEALSALDMSDLDLDRVLRRSIRKLLVEPTSERAAAREDRAQAMVLNRVSAAPGMTATQLVVSLKLQKAEGLRAVRLLLAAGKLRATGSRARRLLYPAAA